MRTEVLTETDAEDALECEEHRENEIEPGLMVDGQPDYSEGLLDPELDLQGDGMPNDGSDDLARMGELGEG